MMYCRNCGREIRDDAEYCTYCGAQINSAQPEYRQAGYSSSAVSPAAKGAAVSAMVWGIVALATCQLPLGFIVGIVGMNKYRFAEALGMTAGMARAGKIMSIVGIVLGAISSVYWIGICSSAYL